MMTPSTRPLPAGSMRFVQGRTTSARAGARPPLSSFGFTPVRPEHPVRAKDDGDGQVSWLAGQGRAGPHSQDRLVPMAYGPMALRLTLKGQDGKKGVEGKKG